MTMRKRAKGTSGSGEKDTPQQKPARKGPRRPRRAGKLPPEGPQYISLSNAVELTQRYRKAAPASEHGGFFFADGLRELLAQPGCVGVRYYHGLDADGAYRIVLVGVDEDGNDITRPTATGKEATRKTAAASLSATGEQAVLLEHHWPCPPYCASGSPL